MQTGEDIRILNEKIQQASLFIETLRNALSKVIVGQHYMIDRLTHWLVKQWSCVAGRRAGLGKNAYH